MINPLYISASCVIYQHKIVVNQQLLFEDGSAENASQFLTSGYRHAGFDYSRFYKMDHLSKLGWLSAEYLLASNEAARQRLQQMAPQEICLLLMNANSSMDTDARYYPTVAQMASPALFVYTLPNIIVGEICIRQGWKGENMFLVSQKFDAAFFQQQVALLMQTAGNEACLCGWVEWLGEAYRSVLFLVEKNLAPQSAIFTTENIKSIYPE